MRATLPIAALLMAAAASPALCETPREAPATAASPAVPDEQAFARDFSALAVELGERLALPGLTARVVRHDRTIAAADYGMADIGAGLPAGQHTRWYIASSTKAFFGTAMARLARRGEIDLDWTLAELAPDVAFPPELRASEVTLRRLLSHTHGLAGDGIPFRLAYSGEHDPETLWRLLGSLRPSEKAPLGTFAYGNLGYNLAAMLVERRLGRRWQDIVDQEVTGPLGMGETLTQGLEAARAGAPFAWPYAGYMPEGERRLFLVKHDGTMQSAGGMYASAADMARWLEMQLSAAQGPDNDPLAEAIREAQQPAAETDAAFGPFQRKAYGLGWYSGPYGGHTLYHAFGGFTGAMAHASFMPDADLAVAAMTNEDGAGAMAAHALAAFAYDWHLEGPGAARANAEALISRIAGQQAKQAETRAAGLAERAARHWQMSLPLADYAGTYCSAEMGTLELYPANGGLRARMGVLAAQVEPFTRADTIRLELQPGAGETAAFAIEGGKVAALELYGERFTRCD